MAQKNYTSERNDYKTPPSVYNVMLAFANRAAFDIDVCCSEENIPAIRHYIDGIDDGLKLPWIGSCFLNPPFKYAEKWVRRAVDQVAKSESVETEIYAVLPADRCETKYYQECIIKNPHCCFAFLPKKIGFIIPGQEQEEPKASQKIMIAIFSKRAAEIAYTWNFFGGGQFKTNAFLGKKYEGKE